MRTETPEIYEDLQRKLMDAHFRPGTKLKPSDLQRLYGCSANTVRDVLLRLSNVGLVEFESQRGFRVSAATIQTCNDITRFRILLEQEGAVLSMRAGGVAWEAQLSAAHSALGHIEKKITLENGNTRANEGLWSMAERNFHETLISASRSPILRRTHAAVYRQFRQQMVNLSRDLTGPYFQVIISEHQKILDAALSGNEAECRAAIEAHLRRNIREDQPEAG